MSRTAVDPKRNFMEFVEDGNSILCYRRITDKSRDLVTSFDAHLEEVAPHVAGVLSTRELAQLEQWLRDRKRLQQRTRTQCLLDCVTTLLEHTQQLLAAGETVDTVTAEKLIVEMRRVERSISEASTADRAKVTRLQQMPREERLKKQLKLLAEQL